MKKSEMLRLLGDVHTHISQHNFPQSQSVKDSLFKVKFLISLVRCDEITNLTQLFAYVLYIGPEKFNKEQ